jgi:hypothetical protein
MTAISCAKVADHVQAPFGCRGVAGSFIDLDIARRGLELVRKAGLEPAWLAPPPPQDGVSANSTTSAFRQGPQSPHQVAVENVLRGARSQPTRLTGAVTASVAPEMLEDSEPEEQVLAIQTGLEPSASGQVWHLPSQNSLGCEW